MQASMHTKLQTSIHCCPQALFRKMLYLTEHDPLVRQGTDAAEKVNLGRVSVRSDQIRSRSCVA